jgi:hypothetical protein
VSRLLQRSLQSLTALALVAAVCLLAAGQGRTDSARARAGALNSDATNTGAADSNTANPDANAEAAKSKPVGKANNRPQVAITPEREAAAMTFVERNHGELSGLLASLKTNQPRQYEQAIREIYRVTERLAGIQERDPLHYELEVKLWTAQSQVQLLAARLKMGDTQEQRKQLREALSAQIAARLEVLKHQRAQAAQRLGKMDRDISQIEATREQTIERQLDVLTRNSSKSNGKTNPKTAGGKSPVKRAGKATERKAAE